MLRNVYRLVFHVVKNLTAIAIYRQTHVNVKGKQIMKGTANMILINSCCTGKLLRLHIEHYSVVLFVVGPDSLWLVGIVAFSLSSLRQTLFVLHMWHARRNSSLCGVKSETQFPKHIILPSPALAHGGVIAVLGTWSGSKFSSTKAAVTLRSLKLLHCFWSLFLWCQTFFPGWNFLKWPESSIS